MPLINRGFRNVLLISAISLLSACDSEQTKITSHIAEGKQFFKSGDYQQAKVFFDKALAVDPDNSQTYLQIADELSNLGAIQAAASYYQLAAKQDPTQVTARIKLAQILFLAGNINGAEKLAKEVLSVDAENNEATILMGGILSAQNNTDAAFMKAEQILKNSPNDVAANLLLASLNAKIGKSDKAKAVLLSSIENNPKNTALRAMLVNLYSQTGEADKARELLTDIISIEPNQFYHRQQLAAFFIKTKQLDKAEDILRTATKDLPDDEQAKLSLIEFLAEKRSTEVAIAELIPMLDQQKQPNYTLRFKLADLQMAQKHYSEVEEILKETVNSATENYQRINTCNKLAQFYLAIGKIEEAKALINTNLTDQPKNSDALILKANIALVDHDANNAIAGLRALLADEPDNIKALTLLASAHQLNNAPLLAIENLQKIIDSAPNNEDVRLELINLQLKTGKAEAAEESINTLFKLNPGSKKGLDALFKIYLAQNQWQQAVQVAKQLQANYANDASGFYLEGLAYQAEGKFAQSLEPLQLALQKQPEAIEPLSHLITGYLALKQTDKAVAKLNEIIKATPEHFFAYNLLGSIYGNNSKFSEAAAAYQKAIELKPDWSKSYRNLALIKRVQNKPEEAIALLNKAIDSVKDSSELVNELVQIYLQRGEHDKAIAVYEKIHKQHPDSLIAINDLVGYVANYATSAEHFVKVKPLVDLLSKSNNPYLLDTAGWFFYRQNQYSEAQQTLLKARDLGANSAISQFHLGMVYHKLGDNVAAKSYLQKAVDQKVEFNGLKAANDLLKSLSSK